MLQKTYMRNYNGLRERPDTDGLYGFIRQPVLLDEFNSEFSVIKLDYRKLTGDRNKQPLDVSRSAMMPHLRVG